MSLKFAGCNSELNLIKAAYASVDAEAGIPHFEEKNQQITFPQ
jgi:hypothetical protein